MCALQLYLTSKEVDSVLRESLEWQLQYFAKRLKVDLSPLAQHEPVLIEAAQRRNLLVHNKGIVSGTYLQRVAPRLVEEYGAKKDKKLHVLGDYFRQITDVVEVAGIILLQQCWRKWKKDEVDSADSFLINVTFDNLIEERHEAVIQIANYAAAVRFKSESDKRRVCINHAIALRDSGRATEVENVLGEYDWTGFQLLFQIALCAVREQEEHFYNLLPKAIAAGEVARDQLEEWPLFCNFRGTKRFIETVKTLPLDRDDKDDSEPDENVEVPLSEHEG